MPTKHHHLTKAMIEGFPLPAPGQRVFYFDARVRALGLRVTDKGARSWYVYRRVNGKPTKVRLGEYPAITIEQARRAAEEKNALIARGEDPVAETRAQKQEPTFGELFEWYLEHVAKANGKRSWERDQSRFNDYLRGLAKEHASKISRADIRELHANVAKQAAGRGNNRTTGIYAANRVLALISVVLAKAIAYELIPGPNPCSGVTAFRETSRERRIEPSELARFINAVEEDESEQIRDYVWLSLLTGGRKSNVLAMRWDQIDLTTGTWCIPGDVFKNGRNQMNPLGPAELDILKRRRLATSSEWVFPAASSSGHIEKPEKGWQRILKRAGIKDLRLHDLRRTLGSMMVDSGASLPMIGRTLGHVSLGATSVYTKFSLAPVRDAKAAAHQALLSVASDGDNRSQS